MPSFAPDSGPPAPPVPPPAGRRALDLACALVALPFLGLLLLVMSLVTAVVSPGPVIFRQRRIGYQGREFMMLKFRTMHHGADPAVHQRHFRQLVDTNAPMGKLDDRRDSRLLPGGWLLRASGLDELPQFVNILRGEMSLVGPRPCLPTEWVHFLPAQRARTAVRPGLTGLWQVSGKNRLTFAEMVALDLHYVRHASLRLDLWILLLTPRALALQILDTRGPRAAPPADSLARSLFAETTARTGSLSKPA